MSSFADAGSAPPDDIETPLLAGSDAQDQTGHAGDAYDNNEHECLSPGSGNCNFSGAVANIAITAVGAGMLALPKAYSTVGWGLGLLLTIAVCFLTYFSSSIIVRYSCLNQKNSYGALVQSEFGINGAAALQSAIITHVIGVMIVYLIIIDDMLVGSAPDYHGLLPYFLGPFEVMPWWMCRWFVSLVLLLVVVVPMLISRDLSIVSRFSRFSVCMLLSLAATLVALAGIAVASGKAADVHLLPQMATVGGSGGFLGLVSAILTVLAVSALAFTCQFNLIPVHNSLRDNRLGTMLEATKGAIALSALLYASIAIAGYTLFGSTTEGDVLKNLTIKFATSIIGRLAAEALILFVVAANTINLLINFVLKVWAVRDAGCELILGIQARELRKEQFYFITAGLVFSAYGVSVVVPSVWFLVSLVGSTACVTFSYVFPGLLLVRRSKTWGGKVLGGGAVGLAALMALVAIYNTLTGNAAA